MLMSLSDLNDLINLRRYLFDAANGFFAGVRKDQIREINELVKKIDVLLVANAKDVVEAKIAFLTNAGNGNGHSRSATFNSTNEDYLKSIAIVEAARNAGVFTKPAQPQVQSAATPARTGRVVAPNSRAVSSNGTVVIAGESFAQALNQPHNFDTPEPEDDPSIGEDDDKPPNDVLENELPPEDLLSVMAAAKAAHQEQAETTTEEPVPSGVIVAKKRRGLINRSTT